MLGTAEVLVILCIVLLLFGGKRLPELARSLGAGIREFKQAAQGASEESPVSNGKAIEREKGGDVGDE